MRFLVIGNPENRRVSFFESACSRLALPKPKIMSWVEILQDEQVLVAALLDCDAVRIESPGENYSVDSLLVKRGGGAPFSKNDYEGGRIGNQVVWFAGWQSVLGKIEHLISGKIPVMNTPDEIALMFDKSRCQQHLAKADVPIATILGRVKGADEVFRLMSAQGVSRVFIKPCHSSSASGVVALQRSKDRILATSSVKYEGGNLYNSLRLSRYESYQEVEALLDTLGAENLFMERWFPKLTTGKRVVDFRVLVIDGKARHVVARTSRSPITNLHLGNARGDLDLIKEQLSEAIWSKAMSTCEQAASCFPKCLYVAVDLMISASMESVAVAEVNAFGDLLPNLLSDGEDSYEAELQSWTTKKF